MLLTELQAETMNNNNKINQTQKAFFFSPLQFQCDFSMYCRKSFWQGLSIKKCYLQSQVVSDTLAPQKY